MEFLIAELDGQPIGAMQIINPATEVSHYCGYDVPPNLRAMDIWIGEEAYLGFVFVEQRQFDEDSDCFVFRLSREAWELRSDK